MSEIGQAGKNEAFLAAGVGDPGNIIDGTWEPKDVKDTHVIGLAEFAVAKHNETNCTCPSQLKFIRVTSADSMKVSGSKAYYRLTIQVDDGDGQPLCAALVWENDLSVGTPKKSESFTILK